MRSLVLVFALLVGSCASPEGQSETPAHFVAQVMIAALPSAGNGAAGYAWDASYARVTPPVRWHGDAFAPADMEGTGLRRNGWLEAHGWQFDVRIEGSHEHARRFSVDVNDAVETEALLDALRGEGAEVSFSGDDETAMFYYVTLPGRETAQLEARRTCTPYGSRAARHCRSIMSWNFEAP